MKLKKDFSFGELAGTFDAHISDSIPGYREVLLPECVRQSLRFVQPGTNVYDVGCSTGHLLKRVRHANQSARPNVTYIGIDREPNFEPRWSRGRRKNISFVLCDALTYNYENASLVFNLFTVQFVRPRDKLALL